MVMHARKTQRMSDGYFEKHQAHPYQNSKYSSSKSYGPSAERYERIRDSPNGTYRSDSPDSQSPRDRDRSYQTKNSYLQKIREKERENRDYKRDKYSGKYFTECARSPKEKRSRESEHRTNHDRNNDDKSILHPIKASQNLSSSRDRKLVHNNCVDKRDERERITRVGDWSEHISSSGKKYYYNCKTEVSQWEKPREWIDREKERCRMRDRDRDSDRGVYGSSSSRSAAGARHDKHSNLRNCSSSSVKETLQQRENSATGSSGHWGGGGSSRDDLDHSKDQAPRNRKLLDLENVSTQDMDISPGDSTPTSEISYSHQISDSSNSHGGGGGGPVLLATALPRLISHPLPSSATSQSASSATSNRNSESSPLGANNNASSIVPLPPPPPATHLTSSNTPGPPGGGGGGGELLTVDTNHSGAITDGPPTPTHSETPDCAKAIAAPTTATLTTTSPPNSGTLSSLQGVSSSLQALRPQGPTITPSLANHVREDLISHIRGWPADILEKQAQKHSEEAQIMGSIQCSKVSAELKTARSLVRLTEIQATLQEQRILFLRQQIKMLEEMKSQNSFMSDDS